MRLKSPTSLKLKTRITGTLLIIPFLATMGGILTAAKVGFLNPIAMLFTAAVAVSLLAVVVMMAYLGVCILSEKND